MRKNTTQRRPHSSGLPGAVLSAEYYREQMDATNARLKRELAELAGAGTGVGNYAAALGRMQATAAGAIAELERAEQQHQRALEARSLDEAVSAGRCPVCGRPIDQQADGGDVAAFDRWPAVVFHAECVERIGAEQARELAGEASELRWAAALGDDR